MRGEHSTLPSEDPLQVCTGRALLAPGSACLLSRAPLDTLLPLGGAAVLAASLAPCLQPHRGWGTSLH